MHLPPTLSFCEVQGRYVFLDLAADRYFCLGDEVAPAWTALLAGNLEAEQRSRLQARGLIGIGDAGNNDHEDGHDGDEPCAIAPCSDAIPAHSMLDGPAMPRSLLRTMTLAWRLRATRRDLARRGIAGPAATLGGARLAGSRQYLPREEADAIAQDFARLDLVVSPHNQCLSRSLALGIELAQRGHEATVVLGVRMAPFRAHCWVECNGSLANDRFERVRHYTPIRRL